MTDIEKLQAEIDKIKAEINLAVGEDRPEDAFELYHKMKAIYGKLCDLEDNSE